jgi:hypothetical protein
MPNARSCLHWVSRASSPPLNAGNSQIAYQSRAVVLCLGALGLLLTLTVVPAVFTVDENNYLATVIGLREQGFGLHGTQSLPPSLELYWFDPFPRGRGEPAAPVVSAAPPLYALFALPFSVLGWRGLVALNTLAFLIAALLVFRTVQRRTTHRATPWVAVTAFAIGGFNLDYAQGLWPHMLAVAFCAAGFYFACRAREDTALWPGALAGLAVGIAAGIRYQNVGFAALIGLGLLVWARRRVTTSAAFALGLMLAMTISASLNHARLGSWNPISKGSGYVYLTGLNAISAPEGERATALLEPFAVLWAKVIDFSSHPPIAGTPLGPVPEGAVVNWGWSPDALGAFVRQGAVKKAWIQSSPWLLLSMIIAAWAWGPRAALSSEARADLKAASLVIGGMLGVFALAGFARWDGLCFNQRYFLELMPLAAIALASGLERFELERSPMLVGALGAIALSALALMSEAGSFVRSTLLLKVPIALGICFACSWAMTRWQPRLGRVTIALFGACIGWSLAVHLGDDVAASRRVRLYNLEQSRLYEEALPPKAALIAFGPIKDAAGPLALTRDLVIVDALIDGGADAPKLVEAFLREGRPVFVDLARFPADVFNRIRSNRPVRVAVPGREPILELLNFGG